MLPLSSLDSVVVKHVIKMEKSIAFVIGFQNEGGDDDDVEEGEEVLQSAVKEKELKVRTILQCDVLFFIVCGCH